MQRNCHKRNGSYRAGLALHKYKKRHLEKNKNKAFTNEIRDFVTKWFKEDYSPEQIVGKAKVEEFDCVSVERIYQFIWKDKKQGGTLHKHLRTQGKRYRKSGASKD